MKTIKLKAFTIIEMIVALILMAIVISVAFLTFSLTNKQLLSFQKRFDTMSDYRLLQNALLQDMQNADKVIKQETFLRCINGNRQILYSFEDSTIVRQEAELQTDSFFFQVDSVFFGFEGPAQQQDAGLIDEVSLYLSRKDEAFTVHQRKIYDAVVLAADN